LLDKFFKAGKITPYHLYHVLAIGSVTGRIKFDDLKRNQCRISWGKIIKQKPTTVEYQPLERKNKDFVLGRPVVKKVNWNKDFVPELKIGNLVSLHWDTIVEVLTEKETKMLQDYTRLTLITLCMI
ncbi:MAG: DUF6390 family protein, partial [Candidatus Portnoybacteria bacterium]|nr:DUF6390 family protein [Candidatus Portnoybacteria bacterium]